LLMTAVVWKLSMRVRVSLWCQATFMLPLRYSINQLHWHTPKFTTWQYLCSRVIARATSPSQSVLSNRMTYLQQSSS
jgi:hypothetical protein